MKRLLTATIMMIFLAVPVAFAQQAPGVCDNDGPHGPRGGGMMGMGSGFHPGGGMMGMGSGYHRGDGGMNFMACKDQLNLTDDQISKIKELNFEHQTQMIGLKADLEKAQLNKRHEMMADSPNKDKVLTYTREVNRIHGQMAELRVEHRFAMRGVLTADQLKIWKECRQDRPGRGFSPGKMFDRMNKMGRGMRQGG